MKYQEIIKVSKNSQQKKSVTGTNENEKEIPKERYYISPEERQSKSNYNSMIM